MSMISVQVDELREVAKHYPPQSIAGSYINDAADTIWQLRNDCVDLRMKYYKLKAENAKLRDQVSGLAWLLKVALKYAEEGEIDCCELCERIGTCENHPAHTCTHDMDTPSDFILRREKELGIEADE